MSVGVENFDWLYLKEQPISLPMVKMSTIKWMYDKWYYVRKLKKSKYVKFLMNSQNIIFGLSLPYANTRKIEKCQTIYFDDLFFDTPLSTYGISIIYPK